jgi:hypothetical protein
MILGTALNAVHGSDAPFATQRHIDPSEGLSQNVNRSEKQEKAKRAPEQAPTSGAEIIWAQISALARWW